MGYFFKNLTPGAFYVSPDEPKVELAHKLSMYCYEKYRDNLIIMDAADNLTTAILDWHNGDKGDCFRVRLFYKKLCICLRDNLGAAVLARYSLITGVPINIFYEEDFI